MAQDKPRKDRVDRVERAVRELAAEMKGQRMVLLSLGQVVMAYLALHDLS